MIYGLGTDVANIERFEKILSRFGAHFWNKILTSAEAEIFNGATGQEKRLASKVAKLFAAKEATLKALGTGLAKGVSWKDVEVSHDALGKPLLLLHGEALRRVMKTVEKHGGELFLHLSLSDDYPIAQAVVIIEIL